jgi:uncharacterized membrane protein YeaQ/YmgE (transglycosylase-associated protein family)
MFNFVIPNIVVQIFFWIIFGSIVGIVANFLVNRKVEGCFTSILVGIIGSFLGGAIFNYFGGQGDISGFNFPSILVGVIGSIIFLAILNIARLK